MSLLKSKLKIFDPLEFFLTLRSLVILHNPPEVSGPACKDLIHVYLIICFQSSLSERVGVVYNKISWVFNAKRLELTTQF